MKKIVITSAITLILVVLYFVFQDILPPRTPMKAAKKISGLQITSEYKVLFSNEEWNDFNGDGSLHLEFEVKDGLLSLLMEECKSMGYQSLPIKYPPRELDGALFLKGLEGLYKIKIHDERGTAFDLVVLDTKAKKLMIYVFVS